MALNVLFRQLRTDRSDNFLDLGAAFGANVDFFSQYSCRIFTSKTFTEH